MCSKPELTPPRIINGVQLFICKKCRGFVTYGKMKSDILPLINSWASSDMGFKGGKSVIKRYQDEKINFNDDKQYVASWRDKPRIYGNQILLL